MCLLTQSKVDDVTSEIVGVKESVDGFENDLVVLTDEVTTVKESVDVLDTSVNELNDNFDDLTEELDEIIGHDNSTDSELDDLKDQVADLETNFNNLDDLGPDFIGVKFKLHRIEFKSVEVQDIDDDLAALSLTFEYAKINASEWSEDIETRVEAIEISLGQTTTQPDVEPTQPPTGCP